MDLNDFRDTKEWKDDFGISEKAIRKRQQIAQKQKLEEEQQQLLDLRNLNYRLNQEKLSNMRDIQNLDLIVQEVITEIRRSEEQRNSRVGHRASLHRQMPFLRVWLLEFKRHHGVSS